MSSLCRGRHSPTSHFLRHGKRFIFHWYHAFRIAPGAPAMLSLVLPQDNFQRGDFCLEATLTRSGDVGRGWLVRKHMCKPASIPPPPQVFSTHTCLDITTTHSSRDCYIAIYTLSYHILLQLVHLPSTVTTTPTLVPNLNKPDLRPNRRPWRLLRL